MSIQIDNGRNPYNNIRTEELKKPIGTEQENKTTAPEQEQLHQDRFEHSRPEQPVTYSKNKLTDAQIQQLKNDHQQRMESFQRMLRSMICEQGERSNLSLFSLDLHVTAADSQLAAASIAEGGEYSVDAVATRIMDMAKALSGGDASKIAVLRDAVTKGFEAAGVELGGKLPGICQDTYTEVMSRFDQWEKEATAGTAEQ